MKAFFKVGLSLATALLFSVAASAQQQEPSPLTLHDAVTIALEKNPLRKTAIADTKAASAGVREARSFLMPHLSFSETSTNKSNARIRANAIATKWLQNITYRIPKNIASCSWFLYNNETYCVGIT